MLLTFAKPLDPYMLPELKGKDEQCEYVNIAPQFPTALFRQKPASTLVERTNSDPFPIGLHRPVLFSCAVALRPLRELGCWQPAKLPRNPKPSFPKVATGFGLNTLLKQWNPSSHSLACQGVAAYKSLKIVATALRSCC